MESNPWAFPALFIRISIFLNFKGRLFIEVFTFKLSLTSNLRVVLGTFTFLESWINFSSLLPHKIKFAPNFEKAKAVA